MKLNILRRILSSWAVGYDFTGNVSLISLTLVCKVGKVICNILDIETNFTDYSFKKSA